jgi:tetratricopeptide (TPR) repeat protein
VSEEERKKVLEKKDMYYYSLVASIYMRFEEFDKAIALYNKGIEESKTPEQKESLLYQLGNLYERMRKYDKAEETYIRLHRESGDSLFEPSEILKAMKELNLQTLT